MNDCKETSTYEDLLKKAEKILLDAGIVDAKTDAWYLMEYVTEFSRASYFLNKDKNVPDEDKQRYFQCVDKRASHIPLQHITGVQEFMGLEFKVNEHVLVPRQDTENLVDQALPYV